MILTSANILETKKILEYKGLVTGESLIGANIYKDLFSGVRDVVGGRTSRYEEEIQKARDISLNSMIEKNPEKRDLYICYINESENLRDEIEEKIKDDFKEVLLAAIAKMSPKKFEAFSRALLNRMGVEFTEKGVQISNDGGIDGYGYHIDVNDFRTTRVVIQCKRYNVAPVREPEINQFLGAMNKYQADYGVFITNGRFTNAARDAAREGSPITLIDGNELVRLVKRYELYITPVQTYVLDDFYNTEE